MIIYHGSNVIVKQPKILQSNRLLDFGAGFYTTPNKEQAIRWAQRVSERRKQKARILSVYNYDSEAAERDLIIIRFDEPSIEWLDFVCTNRSGQEALTSYDIAIGAVADDKVYSVVQYYENGVYDKDDAIKRLKVDELYAQILFHTEKSLRYCSFTSYEELDELL